MPSKHEEKNPGFGEKAFREAFERLKNGRPIRLTSDVRVSQNNIAKEAGCDPSALKKSRYPNLVEDIQAWIQAQPLSRRVSSRQKIIGQRNKNIALQERITQLTVERDHCASLLVEADAKILELVRKVTLLEEAHCLNIVKLNGRSTGS